MAPVTNWSYQTLAIEEHAHASANGKEGDHRHALGTLRRNGKLFKSIRVRHGERLGAGMASLSICSPLAVTPTPSRAYKSDRKLIPSCVSTHAV
jgi:hypothetical protein